MKKEYGIGGFIIAVLVFVVITFIQKSAKEHIQQDFEKCIEETLDNMNAKNDSIGKSINDYSKTNALPIEINDNITLNSISITEFYLLSPSCYFKVNELDKDKFKEDVLSYFDSTEPFKHWGEENVHFSCSIITDTDTTYVFTTHSSY